MCSLCVRLLSSTDSWDVSAWIDLPASSMVANAVVGLPARDVTDFEECECARLQAQPITFAAYAATAADSRTNNEGHDKSLRLL